MSRGPSRCLWVGVLLWLCVVSGAMWGQASVEPSAGGGAVSGSAGVTCHALRGATIPAAAIGLPTGGAAVRSARAEHDRRGRYCKVLGVIRPVDPKADDIHFELNLPEAWNGKAVQSGGGTFDGWLGAANGLKRPPVSVRGEPIPLARGYATFGSDSGHSKSYFPLPRVFNVLSASFARNAEQRQNFSHDALKKTHDVAVALIERRYGQKPRRTYFLGSSTGGREAFFVTQLWPEDYDGVLGAYAAWDEVELDLQLVRVSEALYAPGGFLGRRQTKLLQRAVLAACDAADGVRDGVVSDVEGCHFDPATLACPAGGHGKGCLTAAQERTVAVFATPQRTEFALKNGVDSIPGYNVLAGADLTGTAGLLPFAQVHPTVLLNAPYWIIASQVLHYYLHVPFGRGMLHFDTRTGTMPSGASYASAIRESAKREDASGFDLSRFRARGGKFLIVHGTSDTTIPTGSSALYWGRLRERMGPAAVDSFARFYEIPGFGHGLGQFDAGFDALGVLDRWVEQGQAPTGLTVVDGHRGHGGRTRPLCEFPAWPRYTGGDPGKAASFQCVAGAMAAAVP